MNLFDQLIALLITRQKGGGRNLVRSAIINFAVQRKSAQTKKSLLFSNCGVIQTVFFLCICTFRKASQLSLWILDRLIRFPSFPGFDFAGSVTNGTLNLPHLPAQQITDGVRDFTASVASTTFIHLFHKPFPISRPIKKGRVSALSYGHNPKRPLPQWQRPPPGCPYALIHQSLPCSYVGSQ